MRLGKHKVGKNGGKLIPLLLGALLLVNLAAAITAEEVALHDTASDCWMIVDGDVYNLTSFIPSHPGGNAMVPYCGADGSAPFASIHNPGTRDLLPTYHIGPLTTGTPTVSDITLSPPAGAILVGGSITLTPTVLDAGGDPSAEPVAWASADPGVASVTDGEILGVAPGTVIITAAAGGMEAAATITVSEAAPYTLAEIATHDTRTDCWFVVTGGVYDVTDIIPVHPTELGSFCGMDSSFAFYDANHKPTAGYFLLTDFLIGSVSPAAVLSTVNLDDTMVQAGTSRTLFADTRDQYGNMAIPDSDSWTSLDPAIATVDADGLLTGVAPGTAAIAYTASQGGATVNGTLEATVSDEAPALATVVVSSHDPVTTPGNTIMFSGTAYDQYGNEYSTALSWETDNASVGIALDGLFTGVGPGTATVTASSGGVSGDAQAFVEEPALSAITVDPFALNIMVGDTAQLTAQGFDQGGDAFPIDPTWTTTDAGIADIDQAGLVTATGAGIAHLRAADGSVDRTTIALVSDAFYTPADVATHDTRADCWMIIDDKVYDATSFAPIHPAGEIIYSECGNDATSIFRGIHTTGQRLVNLFFIGGVDIGTQQPPDDDDDDRDDEEDDEDERDDEDEEDDDDERDDEDDGGNGSVVEVIENVSDALEDFTLVLREAKRENDGGHAIWKLKLRIDGEEYEAKVDAATGAILKLE